MEYADIILNELDKSGYISYRLFRQHLSKHNGLPVKDLSLLGRDLNKMLIIDNIPENYLKQPENGVKIPSFYGEEDDIKLLELTKELIKAISTSPNDIRPFLPKIRDRLAKEAKTKTNNIIINYVDNGT